MQWYLVAPTYPKSEAHHEYRDGKVEITRGESVKFVDNNDDTFVRYALLRDKMLGHFPSHIMGTDEFKDEVGYIFVCGETLRKFHERMNVDGILGEYLGEDRIAGVPIIRIPVDNQPTINASYDGNTSICVETNGKFKGKNYSVSLKIRDFDIRDLSISENIQHFESGVAYQNTPNEPKKEKQKMNLGTNLFKDLYFGKAPNQFALSFNNQITYNGKYYADNALNDACGLTLDFEGLLYIMPTQELKAGDIVAKKGDAFYFDGKNYISLTTGQKAEYVPTKVLGMTFYSVVKNLAGNMFGTADSKTNPMANMLPFLLLGKDNDSDDLVKFMLLSQGGFNFLQPQAAPEKK